MPIKNILLNIKKSYNITWNELGKKLGVSEHTVRHDWTTKGNTIPYSVFIKLQKFFHMSIPRHEYTIIRDPYWGQRLGIKSRIEQRVTIPETSTPDFAEFYGIMLGDGCIYSNDTGLCIACDSLVDAQFITEYVPNLIQKLFSIKSHTYIPKKSRVAYCVVYSKKIVHFLKDTKFPQGKKLLKTPKIPISFFEDDALLKACLRGIVDTDGSVCSHPHTRVMIHISIVSNSLRKSVFKAFEKIGLKVGIYNKGIVFYGAEKVKKYFDLIGSSNPKHKLKYSIFIQKGYVPKKIEIEEYLNRTQSPKNTGLVV